LFVEDGDIRYEVLQIPGTRKQYDVDDVDYATYIDNPDKTILLAYIGEQITGQIILRKNWNRYAYIEDIVVDAKFRRQGVGRALISQAALWARERELAGIMLETQDNNLGACRFYECCGFRLGGFDRYLYKGINRATDEVALYWYLLFEDSSLGGQRNNPIQ
jgi:ribosomal protein S18 acetylase RimI-like enzyme